MGTGAIAIIVGVGVLLLAVIAAIVFFARGGRPAQTPDPDAGRGPTGQHPDPVEGTPSDTSTPHWDRSIDPKEGPQ